ncbi:MarR family winged helix-turn-helix transcriptional regulator [Streptosporangium sp. NPDC001559]|uniref:MarR family winged helix-turn-helix transcriptional regulator n=1 Tax=Streptosporangium sp. NPDC001559 TaxID=3366187 RepID=UPI0036EE1E2E
MPPYESSDGLDVEALALAVERFTGVFIRLASVERMSFTTLGVLHTLAGSGPLRLSELKASEQVTQPAITQLVTRLERDGLVRRRPDPTDGRAVLVHITPAGAEIVHSRRADRIARLAELARHLDAGQRRAIAEALPALSEMSALAVRLPDEPPPAAGDR